MDVASLEELEGRFAIASGSVPAFVTLVDRNTMLDEQSAEGHPLNSSFGNFVTKADVIMPLAAIGLILITIFVRNAWVKALGAGLLFLILFATAAMWADILEPRRRRCRTCKKRGVTQGTTMLFDARERYDKWNYCRNCGAIYLHVGDRWVAQSELANPSEPDDGGQPS